MNGVANGSGATVGIDLGTTYSALAWVTPAGHVEVVPNADGDVLTPSVVFYDSEETLLVGREASRAALLEPERAAECFKRDMGRAHYGRKVHGKMRRPEVLSAVVLRKMRQDAEQKIGPIRDAIITVPAYFDDTRRKATQDAGRIAGLQVSAIINEPTAAALWCAYSKRGPRRQETFLICDLGGGTFDATLMRVAEENDFETLATDGDVMLGGKDWDKRLLDYVAGEFMRKVGSDPRLDDMSYQELALRVEGCKRSLSTRSTAVIPISHAGHRLPVTVDQRKFRNLTADLLSRVQTTLELLVSGAGLTWDRVDRVLLVGGATRMPMVREMLAKVSGMGPDGSLEADLAVAQGAAVHGASLRVKEAKGSGPYENEDVAKSLERMQHREVNSHGLGVAALDSGGREYRNVTIIPKNTPVPCERSKVFGTAVASAHAIQIRVLEGEAPNPDACIEIGRCRIEDLPRGLPKGAPVEVIFSYSENGRIHIEAVAKTVNRRASVQIVRAEALSSEGVQDETRMLSTLQIM